MCAVGRQGRGRFIENKEQKSSSDTVGVNFLLSPMSSKRHMQGTQKCALRYGICSN